MDASASTATNSAARANSLVAVEAALTCGLHFPRYRTERAVIVTFAERAYRCTICTMAVSRLRIAESDETDQAKTVRDEVRRPCKGSSLRNVARRAG